MCSCTYTTTHKEQLNEILNIVLLQLLVYRLLYFLLLLLFSISLLTPDKDYVSKALVFLIVLYVSSYRRVNFSRAVPRWHGRFCFLTLWYFSLFSLCARERKMWLMAITEYRIFIVYEYHKNLPYDCIKDTSKITHSIRHEQKYT